MKEIFTSCSQCSGTGSENVSSIIDGETTSEEIACRTCGGEKIVSNLFLSSDLIGMLNDMKNKIDDIFEKVNE